MEHQNIETSTRKSFRRLLEEELESRMKRNPAYSLRAFAKQLGVNDSSLSQIFRGKRKLTETTINQFGSKLGLSEASIQNFISELELDELQLVPLKELSWEQFESISHWKHDALLELTELKDFRPEPAWISERLGISEEEAKDAIERLLGMGWLSKDDSLSNNLGSSETVLSSEQTTEALKQYQDSLLELSRKALKNIEKRERVHSSLIIATSDQQIEKIREEIRLFKHRISHIINSVSDEKNQVAVLQIGFFPLTEESTP